MLTDLWMGQAGNIFGNAEFWIHGIHLAQTFQDNLGSTAQDAFNNFIESGQVWALGIGLILGYIIRSFTAY